MQDRTQTVFRFFERTKHSLTLQTKIQALAATDHRGLWIIALENGYPVTYAEFVLACRTIEIDTLPSVVARIVHTLQ